MLRYPRLPKLPKRPSLLADETALTRRPWYVVGAVLIVASIVVRQPLLLVVGLLIIALGAIPELWYRFCLSGIAIERDLSAHHAEIGDEITLAIRVENRKLLPLPRLELQDEVPEQGMLIRGGLLETTSRTLRAQLVSVLSLWAFQRVTRRYRVRCLARGVYTFGPMRLFSGDPFGFLEREANVEDERRVVVYPLVVPVEELGLPSRAPFGDRAALRRLLEDPLRVAGARDYVPGDEPRRIHWKATARAGRLQSKVYEPSTHHTLQLFVDARTRENSLIGFESARVELALCAAASVAAWGLGQDYAVGLAANGTLAYSGSYTGPSAAAFTDTAPTQANASNASNATNTSNTSSAASYDPTDVLALVAPSARPEQLDRIREALARLVVWFPGPISDVIAREERQLPMGSTIVYIGTAPALGEGGLLALERLRTRGHAVVMLLTGEEDLPPTRIPTVRLGDGDRWERLVAWTLAERGMDAHGQPLNDEEASEANIPAEVATLIGEAGR